uniref:DUF5320 domain-containing protein n=1 Tax=Desulfobacca acetoxidans TaxID=60893 RepID=A0A7C3UYK3_9BACT
MPGYDGTGPLGAGPGTGWGLGPCGAGRRRGGGQFWGRRFGRGAWGFGRFGRGVCWGFGPRRFFGPFAYGWGPGYEAPADEVQALREEEAYLKNELETIQKRLSELETSSP